MSVNVTLNGTIYTLPTTGDKPSTNWGTNLKNYLVALSTGVLQKAGGNFYLTAAVDFGPSYGLKSTSYSTRAVNIAQTGSFRLGNDEFLAFRNAANNGDLALGVNASDQLTFNGSTIQSALSVVDTATIDLSFAANLLSASIIAGSVLNSHIASNAAIDFSKLAALASGNILVGSAGNVATSVAVSGEATLSNAGAITLSNAAILAKVLTGWTPGAGTITSSDSILSGMQKLSGNIALALTNPMDGGGQLIYGGTGGVATKLAAGTTGYILQSNGTAAPSWVAPVTAAKYSIWTTALTGLSVTTGGWSAVNANTTVTGVTVEAGTYRVYCRVSGFGTVAAPASNVQWRVSVDSGAQFIGTSSWITRYDIQFQRDYQTFVGYVTLTAGSHDFSLQFNNITGANGNAGCDANDFFEFQLEKYGITGAGSGSSLTSAHIFVGNASNVATDVAVSGVIAISNTGVTSFAAGGITNAAINAAAAITRSKLASGSNNHVVINDGSGVMSSEAALNASRGGTGVSNDPLSTITITGAFPLALTLSASTALTLPTSGTLLTTNALQVITNKDIDGGTAADTKRITLSKNTTTNLTALTRKEGTLFYDTTLQQPVIDTGSALVPLQAGTTRTMYTTVFTGSGTWTKATLNPLYVKITVIGGGGGGGGASSMASVKSSSEGAGGGGGGCSIRTVQGGSLGATETVTIGAGGGGGNTSGGNGSAGGSSSFGSWATATGGSGGEGMTAGNGGSTNSSASMSLGGAAGVGSSGDVNLRGDDGGNGAVWVDYYTYGRGSRANFGGGSYMAGRRRSTPTGGTGAAGYAYGGGGAGGVGSVGTGRAGGAGAAGIVIVEEFA